MTILIVEDEMAILSNLKHIVSKKIEGVDFVLDVSDGADAINIIHNKKIDILITDICLGNIDGIEVATALREVNKNAGIIFISAYDDKEYLKTAISLGVFRYIEKPIDMPEFIEAVHSLINHVKATRDDSYDKAGVCDALFMNQSTQLRVLNHDFNFYMGVFKFFGREIHIADVISLISENIFDVEYDVKFLKENVYIIVFYGEKILGIDIAALYNRLVDAFMKKNKVMFVGTQNILTPLEFNDEYNKQIFCLQQAFYGDYGLIENEMPYLLKENTKDYLAKYNNLISTSYQQIEEYIMHVCLELKEGRNLPSKSVCYLFRQFVSVTYFNVLKYNSLDISLEKIISLIEDNYGNFDDIYQYTMDVIKQLCEGFDSDTIDKTIKKYILNNYSDADLSLGMMADSLHFSVSWMCIQFKKITGMTINEYISKVRLEKSMPLLLNSKYSAENVAHMVGFNDLNYFSKFFKKRTGMSISEYRKQNMN